MVTKREIAHFKMSNFFFCHHVFKKPSATEVSESTNMMEMNKVIFWTLYRVNPFPVADAF